MDWLPLPIILSSFYWLCQSRNAVNTSVKTSYLDRVNLYTVLLSLFVIFSILIPCSTLSYSDQSWTIKCPAQCRCDIDLSSKRRIICSNEHLTYIPIQEMDHTTQVLIIKGSEESPHNLSIGRIFGNLRDLERVIIVHSNVPAIGEASFWPGGRIRNLDLSNNRISTIKETDFIGLEGLDDLNLSDNHISVPPSAPFKHLTNLTSLSIARNRLQKLVPRMFFQLRRLETLNLSGNPLVEIHPDDIKDAVRLKRLYLADCRLTRLHSLIYARLNRLVLLDLSNNLIENLASDEFKSLSRLKVLFLDGNRLHLLTDYTFSGLKLDKATLSRNSLRSLSLCAFCNSSIRILDLATNLFTSFEPKVLAPLTESLQILRASNNSRLIDGSTSIENLVRPLRSLVRLDLASVNIDDRLASDSFVNFASSLTHLDLSSNSLINISESLIQPLISLENLNLAHNKMRGLSLALIKFLQSLNNLKYLSLEGSHWSCYRCHILPLKDWLSTKPLAYENLCQKGTASCVRCSTPSDLYGRHIRDLNEFDLEWCPDPTIQLRLATSEPRIGLILALIIIISLIIVIIVVIIMYKHRGAVYYTHEDDRLDAKTVFTIQQAARATAMAISPPAVSSSGSSPPLSPPADTITSNQSSPPKCFQNH